MKPQTIVRHLTAAELGRLCRRLRIERGHTQTQTAELVGLKHYSSILKAETDPSSRYTGTRVAILKYYAPGARVDEVYAVEAPMEVFAETP